MRTLLLIIAALLYSYVPLKESLHMLQQNRYQIERYHTWLREDITVKKPIILRTVLMVLPMCALSLFPDVELAFRLMIVLLAVYAYLFYDRDMQVAYIKKIVYTHRLKRMFCVHVLLQGILIGVLHLFPRRLFLIGLPFVYFAPWFLLFVSAYLCEPLERTIKQWYVKDAQEQLKQRSDLIKIGITGSYGKTSVKHMLHALLSESYYTYMTPHSYNNLMGLTLSIRTQLQSLHQVFIAEMGADHVGEIRNLANFIQPSLAIITAIGPQHLSTFGSQEHIVTEKMQLAEQLPPHGIAVLNYDNEFVRTYQLRNACTVITYGITNAEVDVRAKDVMYRKQGTRFTVVFHDREFAVETRLLGKHNVLNLLAAIAAASALHVPDAQIVSAIKRLPYIEHRLQVRSMGGFTLLDDAYNSNPEGAKCALDVLAAMPGRRFLLTPGFLDLGTQSQQAHITYAKQMKDCADEIILIGKYQTQDIYDTLCVDHFPSSCLHVCDTMKEALALLQAKAQKGDVALIENDLPDAFNH